MNGGLYYFYLLLGHEQAEHRIRCLGWIEIKVGRMGVWAGGNPENVEGRRRGRRHLLQEPDQPRRNLLGLAPQPLPQRLHRWRRYPLCWLQGAWRLRFRNHHLPRLFLARLLHARRKLHISAPPRRAGAGVRAEEKGAGVGAAGDAWGAGGQMEEGSLFFELSASLIYPYFNSTAFTCRSVLAPSAPLLSGNTLYLSDTTQIRTVDHSLSYTITLSPFNHDRERNKPIHLFAVLSS